MLFLAGEGRLMENEGLMNSFTLKLMMAVLMVMDHLHYFLPGVPNYFHYLGRLVAPVFTYLMTQSMVYTSDRARYIRRMLSAGLVMLAGNFALSLQFGTAIPMNIFLSLGISAMLLLQCERLRFGEPWAECSLKIIVLLFLSFLCEGALLCPVMALIFYYLRHRPLWMCVVYTAAMFAVVPVLYGKLFPQILMVFAVPLILFYNGKRGLDGTFARRFFYIIYPLHIWILYIASRLLPI